MQNSVLIENYIATSLLSKDGKHGILVDLCSTLPGESSKHLSAELVFSSALTWLFRLFLMLYSRDFALLPKKLLLQLNSLIRTANGIAEGHLTNPSASVIQNRLHILYDEVRIVYDFGLFDHSHNACTYFLKDVTLSNNLIAKTINQLTVCKIPSGEKIPINYRKIDIRHIGAIYENLLEYQPHISRGDRTFYFTNQRGQRRSSGSFYTPQKIVNDIIAGSIGKKLDEIIDGFKPGNPEKFIEKKILTLRILDPAMGSGYFLMEAIDYMSLRIVDFIKKKNASAGLSTDPGYWRGRVAKNCIFGVDKNSLTADLARLSLWITIGGHKNSFSFLNDHLQTGNSLTDTIDSGFDIIIGNPPYGNILDKEETKHIQAHYPLPWRNETHNIVIPFICQCWQLLRTGGYLSFIIPKAATYVDNWKIVRQFLSEDTDLCRLIDNGQSFGRVLLEMVTFTSHKAKPDPKIKVETGRLYAGKYARFSGKQLFKLDKRYLTRQAFLISINQPKIEKLYHHITKKSVVLGNIADIYRGLSINNQLRENSSPPGFVPILRGRHIRPFEITGQSFADKKRIAEFKPGQLLFQEIVAHVYTPIPHIKLIGAINPQSLPSINTVTNLRLKADSKFTPEFILAALQSKIINWYIYKFIYINAFRTMHFSGTYAGRALLPDMHEETIKKISKIVQKMQNGSLDLKKGKDTLDQYFIAFYANQSLPAKMIREILNVY